MSSIRPKMPCGSRGYVRPHGVGPSSQGGGQLTVPALVHELLTQAALAGRPAQGLQEFVVGDLHEPGRKVAAAAIARQPVPGADEGVLGQIVGQRRVAGYPREVAADPALVAAHELAEGRLVAAGRRLGGQCLVRVVPAAGTARASS